MKIAQCKIKSISPYSQSRNHNSEKQEKELADAYEKRTWRGRMHVDETGHVFIPPMAFSNSLKEAAKYLSIQIAGKGKATYTKHFEAGVLVPEGVRLTVKPDDVEGEWLYLNADGQRGGNKRVWRCMPVIRQWAGTVEYYVLDDIITKDIFKQVLWAAGNLIGIGRFRPRNLGYYGRYELEDMKWLEQ